MIGHIVCDIILFPVRNTPLPPLQKGRFLQSASLGAFSWQLPIFAATKAAASANPSNCLRPHFLQQKAWLLQTNVFFCEVKVFFW